MFELLTIHWRASTASTSLRRSCSFSTPAKGEVCRSSRARGDAEEIDRAIRDTGCSRTSRHSLAHRGSIRPERVHWAKRAFASSTSCGVSRSATKRWYARLCSSGARCVRPFRLGSTRSRSIAVEARSLRALITAASARSRPERRASLTSAPKLISSDTGTSRRRDGVRTDAISPRSSQCLRVGRLTPKKRAASAGRTVGPIEASRRSRTVLSSWRSSEVALSSRRKRRRMLSRVSWLSMQVY